MTDKNPYQAPTSDVTVTAEPDEFVLKIMTGQKLIIYAILVYLALVFLAASVGQIAQLLIIIPLIMSIIGVVRMSTGMKHPIWWRIVLVILLFIPLINIITLASLSSRATLRLRNAGFKVGLLGARARKVA